MGSLPDIPGKLIERHEVIKMSHHQKGRADTNVENITSTSLTSNSQLIFLKTTASHLFSISWLNPVAHNWVLFRVRQSAIELSVCVCVCVYIQKTMPWKSFWEKKPPGGGERTEQGEKQTRNMEHIQREAALESTLFPTQTDSQKG